MDRLVPLAAPSGVAFLGPRDRVEIERAGLESLRGLVAFFAADEDVPRNPAAAVGLMAGALAAIEADAFWLHIDVDVLSSRELAAVDYLQTGGLGWCELDRLSATAAFDSRCRGVSIVIYNPDLDPNRKSATALVDFACKLVARG